MTFVSLEFAVLLAVVLACRLTFGRAKRGNVYLWVLVVASMIFYAWYIPWHLGLLLLVTGFNYVVALRIAEAKLGTSARGRLLALGVTVNLLILIAFKYTTFIVTSANGALLSLTGAARLSVPQILLPIGISFYIFHALSYIIDVYRVRTPAVRDIKSFLLYLAFFPQLVSGPIVRARDFLYQIPRTRRLSLLAFNEGAYLIVRGFFMKLVVADNVSPFVDKWWPDATSPNGGYSLALSVVILFSVQIYADFLGYTDIARGVAYLLGYRLPLNFNYPYIASSFSDFWRRWHISLSSWLRDYLYVPLGGNRGPRWRTYANLLIVMLLGGLWHGPSFTFLAWGGIHGLALAVERMLGFQSLSAWWQRIAWGVVVQVIVLLAWTYFRAASIEEAGFVVKNIVGLTPRTFQIPTTQDMLMPYVYAAPVFLMHLRAALREARLVPGPGRVEMGAWAAVMAYLSLTFYGRTNNPFIYFQF